MKNLKKVLALVIACAMFFTMSSFAFSDVAEDASYLEAVTMLSKLGIITGYEDGTFLPDNTITRAEAAKVLVCALNAEDQAAGMKEDNTFTDVPATHWAAGYVNYGASFGIIAGMGDGTFDPEAPVTYEQIVKMIVAMLGYTPVANVKGGYPTGYLYVANNMIKISKGATGTTGDAAKRWVVARLLFNALEAKIMEQSSWNASDPDYVQGTQTLLKDYLEVTKLEGVVTDTFYQNDFEDKDDQDVTLVIDSIDGYTSQSKLEDDDFSYSYEIGDEYTIDANGTGAEEYLGYKTVAYVKEFDEGDDELVAIAPKANKNSTLEVSFDDFEATTATTGVEVLTKNISFEYYANTDDDEPTTAKLYKKGDDAAVWFLNGNAKNEINGTNDFVGDYLSRFNEDYATDGFVKFLDNDGDGVYDYVFVEEVKDEFVVDEITAKSYKVTDKITDGTKTLDPTDEDVYVTFYKDDEVAEFSDIAEGDVLSVVYNKTTLKNSTVVKVYISSEKVEGYVSTANATKNEYKIGGTVYAKTANCDDIARSDEGVFYLNFRSKIAYADTTVAAGGNYAFLLSVNSEDDFSDGKSYTFRFMNEKGEWIDADLYDRVTYIYYVIEDGDVVARSTKITDLDDVADDIDTATNNWIEADGEDIAIADPAANRVFQYTLNSDGKITKIVLPLDNGAINEDKFSTVEFTDAEYAADSNRFKTINKKGGVDENTVVFNIDTEGDVAPTKKKEVTLGSYTTFKDEQSYSGFAYDYANSCYKCMVVTNATNAIDDEASLLVVDKVELTSSDDEDYFVINGLMDGEEVELETVTEADANILDLDGRDVSADFEDITKGSIIEIAKDGAGYVTDVKVVFDADAATSVVGASTITGDDEEDGIYYAYGIIGSDKASGTAKVIELVTEYEGAAIDGASIATAGSGMKGNIYSVDLTKRTTTLTVDDAIADYLGTLTDDMDDSNVCCAFVKMYDGDTIDIVVYTMDYATLD